MIFPTIIVLLSFMAEGIISNYISMNTIIFEPLFTLISLIIIYPYFHNKEKKYFILSFSMGLLYDIVYTNTFLFNAIMFLIIAYIIKKINSYISNNYINVAIISLIIIIIYRLIVYLVLCLINYFNFDIRSLLYSIADSLVLNMIYSVVLYLITDYISRKKHITKID